MVVLCESNLLGCRSRRQKLAIIASTFSPLTPIRTEGRTAVLPGSAVPIRPPKVDTQKRDAIPLMLDPPTAESQLDKMDFEEFLSTSDVPILVDFYAPWCGPCQLMSKVVTDISAELKGRMQVVKINTDAYPKLASKYRVKGLPTCLLFRDGSIIDRVDGFMPEATFGKRVRFYVSRLDVKFGRR